MEPNKIEKEFSAKLQQREITPSPAAWDRLDAMLTIAEEKKAKPSYQWLYIAASIIGFIAIGIVFFSQTEELVDVRRNDVVYENKQPATIDSVKKENQIVAPAITNTESVVAVAPKNEKAIHQQPTEKNNFKTNATSIQNPIANRIANEPVKQIQNESIITRAAGELAVGNQKNEQLNPNPIKTNETDIAVTAPKLKTEKSIKVNASSLLSEVDNELTFSFREKVIQKIDKNYKTVKVALANRNQQSINN